MSDLQKVTEWSKRIHEWAIDKGWWEGGIETRDVAEIVANFHSEASEAWEEYRAGRMDTWYSWKGEAFKSFDAGSVISESGLFVNKNKWMKPEGFWVEIADLCIRIMDAMEAYGWPASDRETNGNQGEDLPGLIIDFHATISSMFVRGCSSWSSQADIWAQTIIVDAIVAARQNGVDLWKLIELKHRYNETRPYRHGGKKA